MAEEWKWGNFLLSNFKDEEQTGFQEVDPDAGLPFRRESFTDISNIVSGTITLTLQNYIAFKDWYRNVIRQGSIPFDFYDCRVDETRTARLIGKPLYITNNKYYNVSVVLSLDPVTTYLDWNLLTEDGTPILTEASENIIVSTEVTV